MRGVGLYARSHRRELMYRPSLTLISLLVLCSSPLGSQQDTKQNCDLLVRVRTMDERSLETPVQVQVLAPQGLITTANVVGDQTIHFKVSSGKTYRLNVTGTGIQTVTTPYFDVEPL